MSRTPKALRRLSVPVLATMALLAAPAVIGTAPIASAATGTITMTNSPGYGSATSATTNGAHITHQVALPTGQENTPQTIDIAVTGNAVIHYNDSTNTSPGTQPTDGSSGNPNVLSIATNGKSATCSTGNDDTTSGAIQGCNFWVFDSSSEPVTLTAGDVSDPSITGFTGTDHFSAIYFTNCPQTAQNNTVNCTTQQIPGATKTLTVTYLEDGTPQGGKNVGFSTTSSNATLEQGPGTPGNNGSVSTAFGAQFTPCTTNGSGQCSVVVNTNSGASVGSSATISASTASVLGLMQSNVTPYPDSSGSQTFQFVSSATPSRIERVGHTLIAPDSSGSQPRPGDIWENTYKLEGACTPSSGINICDGPELSNVQLNLSVDNGFFTDACTTTAYSSCGFSPAASAGGQVGNVKNDGTSKTVTTDPATGEFTVYISIARNTGFDEDGNVATQLTGTASGGNPITETFSGSQSSTDECDFTTSNTDETTGCPANSYWTTDDQPLNGLSTTIVWETSPALSHSGTNQIPSNSDTENVFIVHLTDQYGNLTSGGDTELDLVSTGAGEIGNCEDGFNVINPCLDPEYASYQPGNNGHAPFATLTHHFGGSYLDPETQRRFVIDSGVNNPDSSEVATTTGPETLQAQWYAPVQTFNSTVTGENGTTVQEPGITDTYQQNYYQQVVSHETFNTQPGNTVHTGVVVTVQANVKDQFGRPVPDQNVSFVRSGNSNCTDTREDQVTDSFGSAGFTFTCQTAGQQDVTVVVTDPSGVQEGRNVQMINFQGPQITKHNERPTLTGSSHKKGVVKLHLSTSPTVKGATVHFYRITAAGGHSLIATGHTNSSGLAHAKLKGLKPGKKYRFDAKVVGLSRAKYVSHLSNTKKIKVHK